EVEAGMGPLEVGQVRDQPALGERLEGAHSQRARTRAGERILRAPQLNQHAIHRLEIAQALLGDLEPRVEATKERDAEVRFKRLNLPAHRGWRQVELGRRLLETQRLRGTGESAEKRDRRQLLAHEWW